MTSRVTEIVVDCRDPEALAAFWCAALGFRVIDKRGDLAEIASWEPTAEQVRERQMAPTLVFVRVPEGKSVKNRLHLDISPVDRGRDEEVRRLLALGARMVDVGQGEADWEVMADPEGNEFCLLRSLSPESA